MITSFIIHMKHVPLHITFRPMMDIISVEEYANQKLRILNNISFSWWTKYTYETWWYFSPKYQHDKSVSNTMHIIWIIFSLIDIQKLENANRSLRWDTHNHFIIYTQRLIFHEFEKIISLSSRGIFCNELNLDCQTWFFWTP